MSTLVNRVARAIWTFRQPLTSLPSIPLTPLSDLFIWREDDDWQTYFELTDMASMFGNMEEGPPEVLVDLIFFDQLGREIANKTVSTPSYKRKVLSIRELLGEGYPNMGTFCVLHKKTPDDIKVFGSSLAERGYISFRYRQAPLKSYVHGNLDAVARRSEGGVERLGGVSLLCREYRLQFELRHERKYEIVLVNTSPKQQKVVCELLHSESDNCLVKSSEVNLLSGGCHAFTIIPEKKSARVVIKSSLVMARPLVFCFDGDILDVLHG